MTGYDAAVVGLGGMGSAAIAHLAARGQRVLGLEQFARGHELGASTGRSRIIRMAYYEDPAYVPLLRRAYGLWAELEGAAAVHLFDRCGILMAGGPHSAVLAGATASARLHGIALETLTRADVARRFPSLLLRDDERVIFEPNAGMVFPEAAVDAHLRVAERAGAELRFETRVAEITSHASGIALEVDAGPTVHARRLAICAGPWFANLTRDLRMTLRTQRNVQHWWRPSAGGYERAAFPHSFSTVLVRPRHSTDFPITESESKRRCTASVPRERRTNSTATCMPPTSNPSRHCSTHFCPALPERT